LIEDSLVKIIEKLDFDGNCAHHIKYVAGGTSLQFLIGYVLHVRFSKSIGANCN